VANKKLNQYPAFTEDQLKLLATLKGTSTRTNSNQNSPVEKQEYISNLNENKSTTSKMPPSSSSSKKSRVATTQNSTRHDTRAENKAAMIAWVKNSYAKPLKLAPKHVPKDSPLKRIILKGAIQTKTRKPTTVTPKTIHYAISPPASKENINDFEYRICPACRGISENCFRHDCNNGFIQVRFKV
jgi:hypothetical protein